MVGAYTMTPETANGTNIEKDEAKPADDMDDNTTNLAEACWGLRVAVFVKLSLFQLTLHEVHGNWHGKDHEELNEHGPGGHVHTVLSPALWCAFVVSKLEGKHARANKED